MNKKQRKIIACAVFAFSVATLFPPWIYTRSHEIAGYGCIFAPPSFGRSAVGIDTSRLMLEWVCILVVAGAACFFLSGETVPASPAPPASAPPPLPASENRKSFSSTKRRIVVGTISALLLSVIVLLLIAIDQAQTIEQAQAKAQKDAQIQQEREQQWQAFAAQEKAFAAQETEKRQKAESFAAQEAEKSQKAESIVKDLYEQQSQKRMQEADSIAQAEETERRQKAESIEREKAKWKSLSEGMSPQQVEEILGHPDGVRKNEYLQSVTWWYEHLGVGYVSFSHGAVSGWSAPVVYY